MTRCTDSWESLRGDPLPWLLDSAQSNLHWRVLVELVGRPLESPAVVRARGGASAAEPVAALLEDIRPDGTWTANPPLWTAYSGSAWRLLAAVQWGADPTDPRLQAGAERLIEVAPGVGGFSRHEDSPPVCWITARLIQGLAGLGWCRHPRFQEAMAWIDEGSAAHPSGGWPTSGGGKKRGECAVTAVSVLDALTGCSDLRRSSLRDRAIGSLLRILDDSVGPRAPYSHPCLGRTDDAEILSAMARASVPLSPKMLPALSKLQERQLEGGRWARGIDVPKSLPVPVSTSLEEPDRWITLKCVSALMTYAVEAELPRMYPAKPAVL